MTGGAIFRDRSRAARLGSSRGPKQALRVRVGEISSGSRASWLERFVHEATVWTPRTYPPSPRWRVRQSAGWRLSSVRGLGRAQLKTQLFLHDKGRRQELYRDFVNEASRLWIDALTSDQPELSKTIAF